MRRTAPGPILKEKATDTKKEWSYRVHSQFDVRLNGDYSLSHQIRVVNRSGPCCAMAAAYSGAFTLASD